MDAVDTLDIKEVKIRPMVFSDIRSALNVLWADIPNKELLNLQIGSGHDLSLIAEYSDCLAGFVLARLIYAGLPMTRVCVIFFIAVKPDYQGLGIGSMLIDELKCNCKAKEVDTIRVLVLQNDTESMKYFKKMGFRRSNIINLDNHV